MSLILAVALTFAHVPDVPRPEPEMRIAIADLDFARADDIQEFGRRVRTASAAFCDRHLTVVTPDSTDPLICRSEMRRMAYRALPPARRAQMAGTSRLYSIR